MNTNTHERMEYLDALRGVAMLNVIYFHIHVYLLGESSVVNDFLVRWRMPLFFFISGFFAFAPIYDKALMQKRVRNRLLKQLYPTFVVWILFILCSWILGDASLKEYILHGIYDPAKVGYWFTFSLVQVFVIYALFAYILSYFKISFKIQTVIYLFVIAIFGLLSLVAIDDSVMSGTLRKIWNILCLGKTIKFVMFFFSGALIRMHWKRVYIVIRHYWFAVVCLIIFAITFLFTPDGENSGAAIYLASRISGLLFMISLFNCIKQSVSSATYIGQYLQRIGRNTLPIYLFHFFILLLIPHFIDNVGWLLRHLTANPVIELISFTTFSVIIAEITLVVDSLLKMSPFVYKVFFAK